MASSCRDRINRALPHDRVAFCVFSIYLYNRPNHRLKDFRLADDLRTIIVIADIHRGLHNQRSALKFKYLNLLDRQAGI